jgi:hypothetical protein
MREHHLMRVISAARKVPLVIVGVPLALIAGLVSTVFGLKRKQSAAEVARYLRNYIEGTGAEWDWDDFTSVPIADPQLDDIRRRASEVTAPDTQDAASILEQLLAKAERLAAQES